MENCEIQGKPRPLAAVDSSFYRGSPSDYLCQISFFHYQQEVNRQNVTHFISTSVIGILGIFTPEITAGRPKMTLQTSQDFPIFPRTPASKNPMYRYFTTPVSELELTNERRWAVLILAKVGGS